MLVRDAISHEKKTTFYKERCQQKRQQFEAKLDGISSDKIVYIDESGINQYLYRTRGRALRGKKVYGEISGKRFKRESFIAGLAQGNLIATMCFEGTCHTELFNEWLEKLLLPQIGPNKVLVLDNASFS